MSPMGRFTKEVVRILSAKRGQWSEHNAGDRICVAVEKDGNRAGICWHKSKSPSAEDVARVIGYKL